MKIKFLAENMITPERRTRYFMLKSGKCILLTGQRYVIRISDTNTVFSPTPVPTKVLRSLHLFNFQYESWSGRYRGCVYWALERAAGDRLPGNIVPAVGAFGNHGCRWLWSVRVQYFLFPRDFNLGVCLHGTRHLSGVTFTGVDNEPGHNNFGRDCIRKRHRLNKTYGEDSYM